MKKILFITAFPPSKTSAAEKNTKRMLKELSGLFSVDLVYFKDSYNDVYKPENDNINIIKVIPNSKLFRVKNALRRIYYHPLFTVRYNRKILQWLQKRVDGVQYASIVFDHSQTMMYARKLKYDGCKVLLSHDIEAQRVGRSSNRLMYRICLCTEKYVLSTPNVKLFALCQKDVDLIKKLYSLDASVNLIYIDERITSSSAASLNDEFVLFGNWARADNSEGAIWLLNGLPQYLSDPITVNIIGKHFPIEKLLVSEKIKVNVLGFVDNPYPMISKSKAMFSPLFTGAGIKVKVIESLACGTPVVGTDVAFEGFSEKYESFMLNAQDLEAFAKQIKQLDFSLEDRLKFKEMFIKDYQSMTIPKWLDENL